MQDTLNIQLIASTVFVQLLKEVIALCVDGPIIPSTLIPTNSENF